MYRLIPEVSLIGGRIGSRSGDDDVVNIHLGIAEVEHCGTESSDIILKCNELVSDLAGLLAETLELLCNGLGCCDIGRLLTGKLYVFINDPVESSVLEFHRIHDLGIVVLDTVVSVLVGICTGKYKNPSVDLVESVG